VPLNMILLDTCTLVWIVSDQSQISAVAQAEIRSNAGRLYVSSISAYEIGVKTGKGKLQLPQTPEIWFQTALKLHGIADAPVTFPIAMLATQLPKLHNDPFDRIIIATALHHGMRLLTPDHLIRSYPSTDVLC
jgi:PIN domain nuclease of toxin-antitoxin system